MKKFTAHTAFFVLGFMLLSWVVDILMPDHYGKPMFRSKWGSVDKLGGVDVLFVGSSRTYRQIDPIRFDNAFNNEYKSFNLGVPATYYPECIHLVEEWVNKGKLKGVKFVFLELQTVAKIADQNIGGIPSSYWLTSSELQWLYDYSHKIPEEDTTRIFKNYLLAWMDNKVSFEKITTIFKATDLDEFVKGRGFRSFDGEINENSALKKRKKTYLADTTVNKPRIQTASRKSNVEPTNAHRFLVKRLVKLKKSLGSNGTRLIMVVHPRMGSYSDIRPLQQLLPAEDIIDLSSPNEFPEFYLTVNAFDVGHLNSNGAKLFTSYLASEFKKRSKK